MIASLLRSRPHGRLSLEFSIFDALQLLMHAHVCAEIVFVVVDGQNGSWRVIEQESVNRGSGFRRIADAELCQQHLVRLFSEGHASWSECCAGPASVFNSAET